MSVSSKRFVLNEDKTAKRNSNIYSMRSLQELDETVASVGKIYRSPKRPGDHEYSVYSNTIVTSDSHTIYTHRRLIDNMPKTERIGIQRELRSSHSFRSTHSSRSKRSKNSRQGDSLERTISRTILQTAAAGVEDAHFVVSQVGAASSDGTPVDFILHDLICVDIILKNEMSLVRVDKLFPNKSRGYDVITPATSDETPLYSEVGVPRSPDPCNASKDDPFSQIDQLQGSATIWSYSEDEVILPPEESFVLTSMAHNIKQSAVSNGTSPETSFESFFNVDDTWTSFDNNPFPEDAFDVIPMPSRYSEGPSSSIVDFGIQRRRERQMAITFSQSTESTFSATVLSSTMAVI